MKAILFGATGMVGQGVLRECLLDSAVDQVLSSIVRKPSGQQNPKLAELVHKDLFAYSDIESQLTGYDVCSFASASHLPEWLSRTVFASRTT